MIMQHVDARTVLFTSVDSFKVLGMEASSPYFILTFFDELATQKGIVLIRGDIVNPTDVSKCAGIWLMKYTLKFYSDINLYRWVLCFNHRPNEFQFDQFKNMCNSFLEGEPSSKI
uniref:Putative mitochondrial f1-atpase assembly protein n=1 Tax=Amblyomma aureolatum TaxID=187763 RepID=A0A1E1X118_9ACAR